jgi:molecular chaperone DnaJ
MDADRRRQYDAQLSQRGDNPAPAPAGARWPTAQRGGDVAAELALDLRNAVLGGEHRVSVHALGLCPDCCGSGARPGSRSARCEVCRGQGEILHSQRHPAGKLTRVALCPSCRGKGLHAAQHCACCAGAGISRQPKSVTVRVPPGADGGDVVRVPGGGDAGPSGGGAGDALVRIRVRRGGGIRREGLDLHSTLRVSLWDAVLGGTATVTTLRGRRCELAVPAGTPHGAVLSLPREGVGGAGAHRFRVELCLPTALTREEEALVRRLAALSDAAPR